MATIRKLILPVILLCLVAAAYFVWRESTKENGPGPGFAGGNGRLEATEIDISTKLAGRITEIHVDEGDFVTKGQLLAVMQTDTLEAQLLEAQAQVVKAQATEASNKAQVGVKISNRDAAKATVNQRQSELDKTMRRLKRSSELTKGGVITEQQYDDDETTAQAARAAVEEAKAQVKVAEAEIAAAQADVAGAQATVKAAEATVATIQTDIKDSHLLAPRDGRVQYRVAQPGEVLATGGRVLNFVDLSDVYMNFFLPTEQAGKVAIGAEARIVLDALPDVPIPATITYVASVAQFTPKTVETEAEREKLMFRIKAKIAPELLEGYLQYVKTGVPGMAWVKLDPKADWPDYLSAKTITPPAEIRP